MVFYLRRQEVTGILLTAAEIDFLGPVPLSHSVQHGASQKSTRDWSIATGSICCI